MAKKVETSASRLSRVTRTLDYRKVLKEPRKEDCPSPPSLDEPAISGQKILIDFTPVPGVDNNPDSQNKALQFWDFIYKHDLLNVNPQLRELPPGPDIITLVKRSSRISNVSRVFPVHQGGASAAVSDRELSVVRYRRRTVELDKTNTKTSVVTIQIP